MTSFASTVCLVAASLAIASCRGPSKAEVKLAERLNKEAAAANARAVLPFDPATDLIVTDAAAILVSDHGQGLAFSEDAFPSDEEERFTAYRLVRSPGCEPLPGGLQSGAELRRTDYGPDICLLTTYEQPPAGAVRVDMARTKLTVDGTDNWRRRLTIRRPGGPEVVVTYYYPEHSDWAPAWAPLLVHSLGLDSTAKVAAQVADEATTQRLIAKSQSRGAASSERWIDQLARSGEVERGRAANVGAVPEEVLARHSEGLLRQFERGLADPKAAIDRALLSQVLARLPETTWREHVGRMIAAMVAAPSLELRDYGELARRLGDEGASAAPVLSRFIAESGSIPWNVAIAACRVGGAAPAAFRRQLVNSWHTLNQPTLGHSSRRAARRNWIGREAYRRCRERAEAGPPPDSLDAIYGSPCWTMATLSTEGRALYLALKRMGLGDQADRLALHRQRADYQRRYRDVGPHSPASVCEVDR